MEQEYDVLVVGGCTAGLFFAARMAGQGYRVLLIEKDSGQEIGKRYDIFHLAKDTFSSFGLDEPKAGDDDFVRTFNRSISRSALDRYPKSSFKEFFVLHRHGFMNRLKSRAVSQGVTVLHDAEFISPVFDTQGRLSGANVQYQGQTVKIHSRLVADASGIPSVVRTSLPEGYGVENFEIGPRDKFYVVLYYVKLDEPERDRMVETCGWPYYKTWKAPQHDPDGAIFGVGANLSFDYAQKCYADFTNVVELPPHKVMYVEKGCTPYRRPPYSFVADGFVTLGDAACLTNPWNGEGITAAWVQAEIAAKGVGKAMENGRYPARKSMWTINKQYYDKQGADFVQMLSMLAGAVDCSAEENDYEFKKSIIFRGDDEKETGSLAGKVLKGVFAGKISFRTVKSLVGAASTGNKIFKHYKEYPAGPEDFEEWAKKADSLWKNTRSMADEAQKNLLADN